MSDENMSAEEAAELVGPWHPEVDGRAACLLLPRLTSTVVNLHAKLDAERAGFDAFADLQRVKLESARAEIAKLRRERDEAHEELLRRWHNSRFQRGMEDTHD